MDDLAIALIIVAALLAIVAVGLFFFVRKKGITESEKTSETEVIANNPENSAPMTMPSANEMSLVEKIEIANQFGHSIMLSNIDMSTVASTKRFQEIMVRGNAIGANLIQGAMPAFAQAQTLAQIAKAAPNGLFTATGPLTELMKYKDGTVGSIVMKGGKIVNHSGFKEVALSVANPAAVVGAGMQAMAMISGQYYMDKISKQLDGIENGIERLIGFHHDANVGKLRSIENRMREIVCKTYVDEADIIALQSGIRDTDSVLMEYTTRLERLCKSGEITEIQIRAIRSRLSAVKELKNLRVKTEEQELYYSFQICLFASRLILESKKAEIAARMKIGDSDKAMEIFQAFNSMYKQSFICNASDFLNTLYKPINDKAESLVKRQWFESKKTNNEFRSIVEKKTDLQAHINQIFENGSDEKMIRSFTDNKEILYLPSSDGSDQRIFISADE